MPSGESQCLREVTSRTNDWTGPKWNKLTLGALLFLYGVGAFLDAHETATGDLLF